MSSPLALGAVSAVLRNLLDNGLIEAGAAMGTTVNVSAVAPDTIDLDDAEAPPRLNLFLHQTTPNAGWSNSALPSRSASSGERLTNAPLALDLHYLLTAYGRADFHAEILLGYAMHLLHERPWLDRDAIRRALDPSPLDAGLLPPAFQALTASDLADQLEGLKVTLAPMPTDEMSKLWSAIQTPYRPSAAYQVSVVLIEGRRPARSPLPVLTRNGPVAGTARDRGPVVDADMGPPIPTLLKAEPPNRQNAVRLGQAVAVTGARLAGAGIRARLSHRLLDAPIEFPVVPNAAGTAFSFTVPDTVAAQAAWPAGLWRLTLLLTPPGAPGEMETNAVPLLVCPAPAIGASGPPLNLPAAAATRAVGPPRVVVQMASRPQVRPEQPALLMLGTAQAAALPRTLATDPLVFEFANTLAADTYFVRLRVDGIDSELLVRAPDTAPVFDPLQRLAVPV